MRICALRLYIRSRQQHQRQQQIHVACCCCGCSHAMVLSCHGATPTETCILSGAAGPIATIYQVRTHVHHFLCSLTTSPLASLLYSECSCSSLLKKRQAELTRCITALLSIFPSCSASPRNRGGAEGPGAGRDADETGAGKGADDRNHPPELTERNCGRPGGVSSRAITAMDLEWLSATAAEHNVVYEEPAAGDDDCEGAGGKEAAGGGAKADTSAHRGKLVFFGVPFCRKQLSIGFFTAFDFLRLLKSLDLLDESGFVNKTNSGRRGCFFFSCVRCVVKHWVSTAWCEQRSPRLGKEKEFIFSWLFCFVLIAGDGGPAAAELLVHSVPSLTICAPSVGRYKFRCLGTLLSRLF